MWTFNYSLVLLVLYWIALGNAQIAIYDVRLENLLKMQQGIGWPLHLNVAEGHEALMKLSSELVDQESCVVITPTGLTFDVSSPPNNTYERWSTGCGLRVRNVVPSDSGRWRLTATRGEDSITGWIEVHVEERIESYNPAPISLQDGLTETQVELSSLNNSYCLVAQPFSESALVPGHCQVTLDRTTRAVQGRWNVVLGLPGRVAELQVERNVAVEAERLDVGYVRDTQTNKLHLYCNILNSAKNVTFCRFQKTTETIGFNVMDGLSDGHHSYYGDGFAFRHCGMTIEMVTAADYGSWRCTVGVQEWFGTTIHQSTPMQALIRVPVATETRILQYNERMDDDVRTLFVEKETSLSIMCRADVSLMYCWFQHPNGSQYTPVEQQREDELFWYNGDSLQTGDCGITFAQATEEDAGEWTCRMGPRYQLGVEITDQVTVRVTGPLAANSQEVGARIGDDVTLYCHTSNGQRPLDYCRFLSPNFVGISIDSTVTRENAILDRFYFTPERDLAYGDCSLTISPVRQEDIGEWTCAALVHDYTTESKDTIKVYVGARSIQSQAGIAGMVVGLIVIAGVLMGTVWYKKGRPVPWQRRNLSEGTDAISLGDIAREAVGSSPRSSNSTNSSDFEMQVRP